MDIGLDMEKFKEAWSKMPPFSEHFHEVMRANMQGQDYLRWLWFYPLLEIPCKEINGRYIFEYKGFKTLPSKRKNRAEKYIRHKLQEHFIGITKKLKKTWTPEEKDFYYSVREKKISKIWYVIPTVSSCI